jgi:predicted esterase
LLGIEYARTLTKILTDAGLKGDLIEFRGGHEIPQEVFHKLDLFLRRVMISEVKRQ